MAKFLGRSAALRDGLRRKEEFFRAFRHDSAALARLHSRRAKRSSGGLTRVFQKVDAVLCRNRTWLVLENYEPLITQDCPLHFLQFEKVSPFSLLTAITIPSI